MCIQFDADNPTECFRTLHRIKEDQEPRRLSGHDAAFLPELSKSRENGQAVRKMGVISKSRNCCHFVSVTTEPSGLTAPKKSSALARGAPMNGPGPFEAASTAPSKGEGRR